jgi:branched-chain amino acid transport system substrate-binding protein
VEHVNRDGGINGRMLELLVRDDGNTPLGIQAADEDLIANGITALIGHSTSGNTLIAYPLVTAHDIILITPYAATNKLTGKDDLFFRTQVNCDLYGKKAAELFQRQGIHSVAMLLDMSNPDFVVDWQQSLQKYFSGTTHPVTFHSNQPVPWATLIKQLMASGPDAVLLLTEASMTGVALQKLAAAGFSGRRYATVWADTPKLLRYAASSAEGLSLITFLDPDNNRPAYLEFSRAMKKQFQKDANARSSRAYEVVTILADALRRAPDLTARSLKKALLSGTYETILGTVRFDRYGDVDRPVYEVVVSKNQFHGKGPI